MLDVLGVHGFLSVCRHENFCCFVVIAVGTVIERTLRAHRGGKWRLGMLALFHKFLSCSSKKILSASTICNAPLDRPYFAPCRFMCALKQRGGGARWPLL